MNVDLIRRGRELRRLGIKSSFDAFFWAAFALLACVSAFVYYNQALLPGGVAAGTGAACPLWSGCVAALTWAGLPDAWAVAAVSALLKMGAFAAVQRVAFLYLAEDESAIPATLTALLVSIITVLRIPRLDLTAFGGAGAQAFWSAPPSAAPMIALACLLYGAHCIYEYKTLSWKQALWLAAVLLLGALGQPGLLRAFLPAYGAYLLLLFLRHPKERRFILRMGAALVPAAAWAVTQAILYAGAGSTFSLQGLWLSARDMFLITALPLFWLLLSPAKETLRNPVIALCLLFAAAGVMSAAFLPGEADYAQTNPAAMSAAFLLWAVMPPRFIHAVSAYRKDREKLRTYAERGALSTASLAREHTRLNRLSGRFLAAFILLLWYLYSALFYLYGIIWA